MRRALRFGLARLIFGAAAIGVLGTLLYLTATVPPEPSLDVLTLDRAQLVVGDAPSRLVVLPHTWALDGLGNTGRALYRIEFHLENVPRQPWGLQSPRLSSRHLVRLNGHWIHGSMLEAAVERRGVPVPTWVDIAPDLLQAGDNLLEIEVVHDYRAGLSVLRLGPESAVWRTQVRDEALHLSVPRSLNLFGVGLALFMLSIWWRRRSERALGLFAALLALLSVRNVAYSSTGTVVHTPGTDVFFYLVNVVAAMLLARFALAWAGRDWRWFRRTMDLGGAALIVGAVVSVSFDAVQQMRVLTYPLVLASLLPSLVLMVLATRRDRIGLETGIKTTELYPASQLLTEIIGVAVQPNKAIVGRNAFAHEAGIHQDGVLKERTTYEIMDATTIGLQTNSIVLGKHSGRHALRKALEELGVRVDGQALNTAFKRFKEVADRKKQVTALDLEAIVSDEVREQAEAYNLASFELHDSSTEPPVAKVSVTTPKGETVSGEGTGDGAVDALLQAINAATGIPGVLKEYHVAAVTADTDALGEVSVLVEHDGRLVSGQSVSTDTLEASGRAYLRALSNALAGVSAGEPLQQQPEAGATP